MTSCIGSFALVHNAQWQQVTHRHAVTDRLSVSIAIDIATTNVAYAIVDRSLRLGAAAVSPRRPVIDTSPSAVTNTNVESTTVDGSNEVLTCSRSPSIAPTSTISPYSSLSKSQVSTSIVQPSTNQSARRSGSRTHSFAPTSTFLRRHLHHLHKT